MNVTVLLSVGCHPMSRRLRPSPADRKAVELAKVLTPGTVKAVYAGRGPESILREYFGFGVHELDAYAVSQDSEIVETLVKALGNHGNRTIFAGKRAETGAGSGQLPYILAHKLGRPIFTDVLGAAPNDDGRLNIVQYLARGDRRRLRVASNAVLIASEHVHLTSPYAHGRAQKGVVRGAFSDSNPDFQDAENLRPARKLSKRIHQDVGAMTAAERLSRISSLSTRSGEVFTPKTAAEAAKLLREKINESRDRGG